MNSGESAKRRLGWKKKLLFALTPLLLLVAAVEIGFRVSDHAMPPIDSLSTAGFVADPELGWRRDPASAETNEIGLRDTPYNSEAAVKVLLLGDSVSEGAAVSTEQTFAWVLEQRLQEADPARTFEVINAGVSGYSTFQELRYLELHGLALEPDVVLLQFCLNDVVERYATLAAYGGGNVFLGVDTRTGAQGVYGWLVRNSVAFEVINRSVKRRAARREEYDVGKMTRDSLSPELEEAWALAMEEVESIRRICLERAIPLVLVVTPYVYQASDPRALGQPQARLAAWARAHDVTFVDLLPPFAAHGAAPLFVDANHFSEAGHALAGDVIFETLRERIPR